MASGDTEGSGEPLEERLRRRFRYLVGGTELVLIVILTLADTFGRGADLHANEFIFGSLIASVGLIAGVEGIARFISNGKR